MKEEIARKIHLLRKSASMTQAELSKGICTQAQISNIEKGNLNPSSVTLFQIAQKLEVDMNYFFEQKDNDSGRVSALKTMISSLKQKQEYQKISSIIKRKQNRLLFTSFDDEQFLLWHDALCVYHLEDNAHCALELIQNALDHEVANKYGYTNRTIEMLDSKATFYCHLKQYDEAYQVYLRMLELFNQYSAGRDAHVTELRILFGLAKCAHKIGLARESLQYSSKGEEVCIRNKSLYKLGSLLLQKGRCLLELGKRELGLSYLYKSKAIFAIEKQNNQVETVEWAIQTAK
ncbi:helix-turn-helix domain-containing protein [Shouchella patagoniensis]|uniref:helix-turn-helix domain-containing protein n=1 Tax=Shouchella patagoniensis TaxID=228576 RepID=UPI000994E2CE|nr:helix-turn-helix domain-containing protein [Shouchella patagoniensis]